MNYKGGGLSPDLWPFNGQKEKKSSKEWWRCETYNSYAAVKLCDQNQPEKLLNNPYTQCIRDLDMCYRQLLYVPSKIGLKAN